MMRFTWISKIWRRLSPAWSWVKRLVYGVFNRIVSNFLLVVSIILIAGILGVVRWNWEWIIGDSWTWLGTISGEQESKSTTLSNLGLLVGAAIAIILAVWRSKIADRQADAAQRQAEITQSQVEIAQSQIEIARSQAQTAQQSLLNERYQRGVEMLGNEVFSVRLGGIYALQQLAQDNPEQYHVQVMKSLCAFVRHPPVEVLTTMENLDGTGGNPQAGRPRADVREAMRGIGARNEMLIGLEQRAKYKLDLHGANLSRQPLNDLNLSGAELTGADLSSAILSNTDLSKSQLFEANLSRSDISGANLFKASLSSACLSDVKQAVDADFSEAYLSNAILSGANLAGAKLYKTVFTGANLAGALFFENGLIAEGLTQKQINWARAEPIDNPPQLDTLEDHETGEMIFWGNRPQRV